MVNTWDLHTHLTSALKGDTPAEKAASLIAIGDRHGIERYCVFMGIAWSADPTPDDFRRQNDEVLEAINAHPERLFGFAYLNPKHPKQSLRELERCVADGPMVGVKLWIAEKCTAPKFAPVIERAAELGAVIFQHTWDKTSGNQAGESTPEDLAELAARYPDTAIICGHTGGNWEKGIAAVRAHKNVSIGLGGFDPTAGVTEMAVRELGADRIIWGSDAPGRSFASQLAKVTGATITQESREKILGGNLRRMMAPILKSKAIRL